MIKSVGVFTISFSTREERAVQEKIDAEKAKENATLLAAGMKMRDKIYIIKPLTLINRARKNNKRARRND